MNEKRAAAMTPERWALIEELFARVLELPPARRAASLADMTASDPQLRRDVEALLAEDASEPGFLEAPAISAPLTGQSAQPFLPEQIGPYRILGLLGRGGMGQVFLAEREAPGFRQRVALKIMRRGIDTDDLIGRFHAERQILASLNHPNIARLLDVGATEQGLPYLVMEYVEGQPVLEFCTARRLPTTERIQLFLRIVSAVEHAHRSLIVHRDIKPANILVGADGTPKLLDFGIAKILAPGDIGPHTQTRLRLLTPDYASPEQIRGVAVTTACDVYALGTLLYELLAATHPLGEKEGSAAEMQRRVLEFEPPPPASVATDAAASEQGLTLAQLQRRLHGDLDTIILKALRKEPEARYASAHSMGEDLQRHLAGLPILARRPTTGYRLRKFVRRHRVAVAGVTGLVATLIAATLSTFYQSARVRREAELVMRERDKLLQVRGFLLEMFGTTGPDQATGDSVTARQLLDRRAATLDRAFTDPEMRAEMMYVLAEGYEKLGLLGAAEPLARRALEARREWHASAHPDLVASLNQLGWVLHQRRQWGEAEPLLREAVTLARSLPPEQGGQHLARALNDLGVLHEARRELDEAAALYRQSLEARTLGSAGTQTLGHGVTLSNLAVVLYRQRDLAGAIATADSALRIFQQELGPDHLRTTIVQSNLAVMQSASGDREGAVRQYREILEQRKRVFGPDHATVALSMSLLAYELTRAERYDEAEPLLLDALRIQRSNEGASPDQLASTLALLGDIHVHRGQHGSAVPYYQEAVDISQRVFGKADESVMQRLAGAREAMRAGSAR